MQQDDGQLIPCGNYIIFYSGLKNILYVTLKAIINDTPTEVCSSDNEDEDRYPVLLRAMKKGVDMQLVCKTWKNIIESDKKCMPFSQRDADIMLRYAVMHNQICCAQKALWLGANVDSPFKIKQENIAFLHGATPLFSAVYNKNSDMVKMLLDNKASKNIVTTGMLTVKELAKIVKEKNNNKQCTVIASLLGVDGEDVDTQDNV